VFVRTVKLEKKEVDRSFKEQKIISNFGIIANDHSRDKESLYAKGLIAFEYEKLIGKS
jgi:hypothetical protein